MTSIAPPRRTVTLTQCAHASSLAAAAVLIAIGLLFTLDHPRDVTGFLYVWITGPIGALLCYGVVLEARWFLGEALRADAAERARHAWVSYAVHVRRCSVCAADEANDCVIGAERRGRASRLDDELLAVRDAR